MKLDKDKQIKKELVKLTKIFANIPQSKKDLVETLIQNAAFMAATLAELQEIINEEGPVITSTNGNGFDVTQEHPAQRSYVGMMAKYTTVINQLSALLPDAKAESVGKAGESLAKFVAKGKPIELR